MHSDHFAASGSLSFSIEASFKGRTQDFGPCDVGSIPAASTKLFMSTKLNDMNSTEEWLRYIESQVIMKQYGVKGYASGSSDPSGSVEE